MIKGILWLVLLLALIGFPTPAMALVLIVVLVAWLLKLFAGPILLGFSGRGRNGKD